MTKNVYCKKPEKSHKMRSNQNHLARVYKPEPKYVR